MNKIITILLIAIGIVFPQEKDPDKILDAVKNHFSIVKDYEVDVKIKVDVEFIKAPVSEATIFYKQPDKIRVKSEKFALLPKEGINFSPVSLLEGEHTAIYQGEDTVDGKKVSVIKVIPLGDRGDIVLTTLWIDHPKKIIRKIETTTKTAGTFVVDLKYENSSTNYPLPSSMVFSFNVENLNIPKGMTGETEESGDNKKQRNKPKSGKVYITYSNYKINKGIPDSVFEEK